MVVEAAVLASMARAQVALAAQSARRAVAEVVAHLEALALVLVVTMVAGAG